MLQIGDPTHASILTEPIVDIPTDWQHRPTYLPEEGKKHNPEGLKWRSFLE